MVKSARRTLAWCGKVRAARLVRQFSSLRGRSGQGERARLVGETQLGAARHKSGMRSWLGFLAYFEGDSGRVCELGGAWLTCAVRYWEVYCVLVMGTSVLRACRNSAGVAAVAGTVLTWSIRHGCAEARWQFWLVPRRWPSARPSRAVPVPRLAFESFVSGQALPVSVCSRAFD